MSKPIFITIDDVSMIIQPVDISVCFYSFFSLSILTSTPKKPYGQESNVVLELNFLI